MVASPAGATVSEPDGTSLPQPVSQAELSVITSRGFLASDDTLAGLFAIRGENIDPVKDAHQTPGTFSPQCGFTGQIVLHGGGCANALGWYNATPGSMTPPPANQIYTLVPANLTQAPPNGISCKDTDFCPMAEMDMDPNQAGQHTWVVYSWNASAIANNPNYKGGQVGFALLAATNQCTQTKYSEADLNTISTQYKVPWVTTLIYQSTVNPSAYYIAFEDLPMPASSWTAQGCDGDFNDFVFYVTGLDCQGGGVDCPTGMPGVCADGTTQCSNGGMTITCQPNVQPTAEVCNGLDDDCDGTVDNPDAPGLCPSGQICYQGSCIPPCSTGEFPCLPPYICDKTDELCKDPACTGVVCGSGQVCVQGTCIGGCENTVCPPGQICRIGKCVDPCAGVQCESPQVCDNGVCVSPCSCRPCADGQTCVQSGPQAGACVDTGCENVACNPPATVCVKGQCQDGCQGVVCPTGQVCSGGQCETPDGGPVLPVPDGGVNPGTGGAGMIEGTGGSQAAGTGGSLSPGTGGSSGSGTGGSSGAGHEGGVTTCSCDTSSGPGAGGLALLLAAVAVALARRADSGRATSKRRRY